MCGMLESKYMLQHIFISPIRSALHVWCFRLLGHSRNDNIVIDNSFPFYKIQDTRMFINPT